jgi:hypothetical protein
MQFEFDILFIFDIKQFFEKIKIYNNTKMQRN